MLRYIFPGLALGAALGQTGQVTDRMVSRSAEALVELLGEEQLARRATFPDMDCREIGVHLAARVFQQAVEDKSSMVITITLHTFTFLPHPAHEQGDV